MMDNKKDLMESPTNPFGLDTVRTNQNVTPRPGIRPFDTEIDVIRLDGPTVVGVKPSKSVRDNTRNDALPVAYYDHINSIETPSRALELAGHVQTGLDIVDEFNPKMFKFAPYSGEALKIIDLVSSRNAKEVEEKVLNFAIEKIGAKAIGSGTGFTAVQGVYYYYNSTRRGLNDLANAEFNEMNYNYGVYRRTGDEMYSKHGSSVQRQMYIYLNKMREMINENKK